MFNELNNRDNAVNTTIFIVKITYICCIKHYIF